MRLTNIIFYVLSSLLLTSNQAQADIEDPVMRGFVVGGVSLASTVGGSLLGTVSGFILGDYVPGDYAPIGVAVIGGVVGATIGAPLGAYAISDYAGADKMTVTRNTAIVSSIGALCALVGSIDLNDTLMFTGGGVILISPIAAGITASDNPSVDISMQSTATPLSFTPVVTSDYTGFILRSQF